MERGYRRTDPRNQRYTKNIRINATSNIACTKISDNYTIVS